jgi:hypothetical protein
VRIKALAAHGYHHVSAYRYDLHLAYLPGKFFGAMNRGTSRLAARWTYIGIGA